MKYHNPALIDLVAVWIWGVVLDRRDNKHQGFKRKAEEEGGGGDKRKRNFPSPFYDGGRGRCDSLLVPADFPNFLQGCTKSLGQRFCVLCSRICTPSLFSPSPLYGGSFKTKHALNFWPKDFVHPCRIEAIPQKQGSWIQISVKEMFFKGSISKRSRTTIRKLGHSPAN